MSRFIKSAIILAAFALAAPAALAGKPAAMQVVVSYGDLNLQNKEGIKVLLNRIGRASTKVCGNRPTTLLTGAMMRFRACHDATMADAIRRIDIPTVTTAWVEKTGKPTQVASR